MLHAVHEVVKTCVKLFNKSAAAKIILFVVEALIASDEGDEVSSHNKPPLGKTERIP